MKKLIYFLMALLISQHVLAQACQTLTFNGTAPIAPTVESAGVGGRGSIQTYTVPAGVTAIRIDARGAKGGRTPYHTGGQGGRVRATYSVTPGDVLYILVGGKGGDGAADDVVTRRTTSGGGGGGATVVSKGAIGTGTLLLVAGGGGGSGRLGGGGNSNNFNFNSLTNIGADGGSFSVAGSNSNIGDIAELNCGQGGQALNVGGNGGANTCFRPETNGGGYGGGGAGNYSTPNGNAGGGGGGGYLGGNGGGTSGGDGGTNYTEPTATNVLTNNHTDDNGSVFISVLDFNLPASPAAICATNASTVTPPAPPAGIVNGCGTAVIPTGPVISATATNKNWTWTYSDQGITKTWVYSISINAPATIQATTPQPACVGSMLTLQSNCPNNSTANGTIWRSSAGLEVSSNTNLYQVEANSLSYTAQCFTAICGNSPISKPIQLSTKRFDVQFLNVETSTSNTKAMATSSGWWASPTNSGNALESSTADSPAIYYTENNPAPRYWTAELQICDAKLTPKSVIWDLYRYNEVTGAQEQTFYSIENGAPWFMFANVGYSKLYTLDHPVYGFGASYAGGFPKGKYVMTLYLKDAQGLEYGSVPSPTTRTAQGNTLSTLRYYFNITSLAGTGMGAARIANSETIKTEVELASAYPNPAKSKLNVIINESKGQEVILNMIDIMGRSIMLKNIVPMSDVHTEEIDMNNTNTGMYFIKIQTPAKRKTIKITKE